MSKTRISLIGGFLGSGKTTLINKIAQEFIKAHTPIGVITNDQGELLVDTEFIKRRGLDVEEVSGGCFCCNFPKLLENTERLIEKIKPQYILAEPVGSCTDLIATVMAPLKKYHSNRFSVAPLIVLIDAPRLLNQSLDTSSLGGYLRNHQAEEAEYVLLTKIDEVDSSDISRLVELLRSINSNVIPYSAVTNEGFLDIMKIITSNEETARKAVDIDYDIYADAEAELGWYNGVYEFNSAEFDSYDLSISLLMNLASKYDSKDIAHAKVGITNDLCHTKVSLIGSEFTIGGVKGSRHGKGAPILNFNARIVSSPEDLQKAVRHAVEECFKERGISYQMKIDKCFSPGRPNPTYRICGE